MLECYEVEPQAPFGITRVFGSSIKNRAWRDLTEDKSNIKAPENHGVFRGLSVFISQKTQK